MPRPSQSQILEFLDVQHTYQWDVNILRQPAFLNEVIDRDRWNLQCMSHEIPVKTIESSELQIRGHNLNIPGRVITNGVLAITLFETTDAFVRRILSTWITAFEERDQGEGAANVNDYLGDFVFNTFNNNDPGTPNYSYQVISCYPESYSPGSFEGANSESATMDH